MLIRYSPKLSVICGSGRVSWTGCDVYRITCFQVILHDVLPLFQQLKQEYSFCDAFWTAEAVFRRLNFSLSHDFMSLNGGFYLVRNTESVFKLYFYWVAHYFSQVITWIYCLQSEAEKRSNKIKEQEGLHVALAVRPTPRCRILSWHSLEYSFCCCARGHTKQWHVRQSSSPWTPVGVWWLEDMYSSRLKTVPKPPRRRNTPKYPFTTESTDVFTPLSSLSRSLSRVLCPVIRRG